MKRIILYILFFICGPFVICAQTDSLITKIKTYKYVHQADYLADLLRADSLTEKENSYSQKAFIKDRLGLYYYHKDYSKAIAYFDSAANYYHHEKNKLEGNCYLNIAGVYDEQMGNNKLAIKYLYQSLQVGEENKDTLHQATILKYIGALKSNEKDFASGKKDIDRAIELFSSKNFRRGVAVCYYDLAIVYFNENKLDSCILALNTSKKMQTEFKSIDRIFGINNYLLKVYQIQKNWTIFLQIKTENETNYDNKQVKDPDRILFCQILISYFGQINATADQDLYQNKLSELKNKKR